MDIFSSIVQSAACRRVATVKSLAERSASPPGTSDGANFPPACITSIPYVGPRGQRAPQTQAHTDRAPQAAGEEQLQFM